MLQPSVINYDKKDVDQLAKAVMVMRNCSFSHNKATDSAGALLTCGRDDYGYGFLGHGEGVTPLAVPTPVPSLQGVKIRSVAVGDHHTLALGQGGVYSFGPGRFGRLGRCYYTRYGWRCLGRRGSSEGRSLNGQRQ